MARKKEASGYHKGEALALVAPLLGCSVEDLEGLIIIGVPKIDRPAFDGSMRIYYDTPDEGQVAEILNHTRALLLAGK